MCEEKAGVVRAAMVKGMTLGGLFITDLGDGCKSDLEFCGRVVGACSGMVAMTYKGIADESGAELADRWMAAFVGETRRLLGENYGKDTAQLLNRTGS